MACWHIPPLPGCRAIGWFRGFPCKSVSGSSIRDGALSFDELLVMAAELQQSMQNATATTELPHDVDYDRVDALLATMLA